MEKLIWDLIKNGIGISLDPYPDVIRCHLYRGPGTSFTEGEGVTCESAIENAIKNFETKAAELRSLIKPCLTS